MDIITISTLFIITTLLLFVIRISLNSVRKSIRETKNILDELIKHNNSIPDTLKHTKDEVCVLQNMLLEWRHILKNSKTGNIDHILNLEDKTKDLETQLYIKNIKIQQLKKQSQTHLNSILNKTDTINKKNMIISSTAKPHSK